MSARLCARRADRPPPAARAAFADGSFLHKLAAGMLEAPKTAVGRNALHDGLAAASPRKMRAEGLTCHMMRRISPRKICISASAEHQDVKVGRKESLMGIFMMKPLARVHAARQAAVMISLRRPCNDFDAIL